MNSTIEKLKAYLDKQPANAIYNDAQSLMELLCYIYMNDYPIDSAVIRYQYQQLNFLTDRLTLKENDQISNLTVDLCDTYIRKAFLDGIQVGYHLLTDLSSS